MKTLSSADVIELSELTPKQLRDWIDKGLITPVVLGEGQGNHHRFSLMQAVALTLANSVRKSERGCNLSYVGLICRCFEELTERRLIRRLSETSHFMMVISAGGKPHLVLDAPHSHQINLKELYEEVLDGIEAIENRLQHRVGRSRGLASVAS